MLTHAAAMATIPVVDMTRARRFYEQVLGLKPAGPVTPDGLLYECGRGTRLFLFQRQPTKADHTVAAFVVDDIEKAVHDLKRSGLIFEEYDVPGLKTINSIATLASEKAAFFKDSEGNVLAVSQFT